ncbi:MAG: methionine synthase [Nitrospirota bacterium]
MSSVTYIEHLPAVPKRRRILNRLGYQEQMTVLDNEQARFLDQGIKQGLLLCQVQGVFGRFKISKRSPETVELDSGLIFKSRQLARMLVSSDEMVLMASTAGKEVTNRISFEIAQGNPALGVIFDAVASQAADAGLDSISKMLNTLLAKEGKRLLRRRFSPGYGDLSLCYQRILFDLLKLEKLELNLTETFMIVPEKSVLAITGIQGIKP